MTLKPSYKHRENNKMKTSNLQGFIKPTRVKVFLKFWIGILIFFILLYFPYDVYTECIYKCYF